MPVCSPTRVVAIAVLAAPLLALGAPITLNIQRELTAGRLEPGAIEPAVVSALTPLQTGDFNRAEQELELLRKANPSSPVPLLGLAEVAARRERLDEALSKLNAAYEVAPRDWRVASALARFHQALNQSADAERWMKSAILLAPNLPKLRSDFGDLYAHQKRYEESLSEYAEALRVDPEFVPALLSRGDVRLLLGQAAAALTDFDAAARLVPSSGAVHLKRGLAFEGAGKPEEAKAAYQKTLQLEPESVVALNNLAWLMLSSRGDLRQAEIYAKRAVELAPAVGGFRDSLAAIYRAQGRRDEAVQEYRRALELDPSLTTSAEALRELGAGR